MLRAAPAAVPKALRQKASITNMAITRPRCMPMARRVPISTVRSRRIIWKVFEMPITMTAIMIMKITSVTVLIVPISDTNSSR